jgi:hypothetical protein
LIIFISLKYVAIALRVDNGGESGILALIALLRRMHGRWQPLIMFVGLCGAALVCCDAAITPAISRPPAQRRRECPSGGVVTDGEPSADADTARGTPSECPYHLLRRGSPGGQRVAAPLGGVRRGRTITMPA